MNLTRKSKWAQMRQDVMAAPTDDFVSLIETAGLDPKVHLRFADWSGVSFAGCDLRGFDFTGARLHACNFKGARIEGARFDQAEIAAVEPAPPPPPGEGGKPGRYTGVADLRLAADWVAYAKEWRKAPVPPGDAHLHPSAVFQDAPFAPEMVVVPAGSFEMGSTEAEIAAMLKAYGNDLSKNEGPQRRITIPQPFAVGRFAVTFAEWDATHGDPDWKPLEEKEKLPREIKANFGRADQPVINVSWRHATAYCRWLSAKTGQTYRLLSEAEWEYACRAGTSTLFWWGDDISTDQANYDGKYLLLGGKKQDGVFPRRTLPVKSFDPNPWGLYQMHGNVWEWCEDEFVDYAGAPIDGTARTAKNAKSRVVRGGSWINLPRWLRAASRLRNSPVIRYFILGFRVGRALFPART